MLRTCLLSVLFTGFLWLSWSGQLDALADNQLQPAFKKALITFAATRGLNAIISTAQGTEIALQPAGVGITLSAGEILDPLNDLIERFSWLILMATASLGIQITLTEIFAHPAPGISFAVLATVCLVCVWLCRTRIPGFFQNERLSRHAVRILVMVILIRFSLALITMGAGLLSSYFLEEQQIISLRALESTTLDVEAQTPGPTSPVSSNAPSLMETLSSFLQEQKESLDMPARISGLKIRVEQAISHIINLIVVFTLQTLIIPLAILYLFHKLLGATWKILKPPSA